MRKFKKLNRKGFTLIELLAVIVILAVVMGIAANSVLGVMNKSRRSGLENGAVAVADAFRTKYAEALYNNETTVFGVTLTDGFVILPAASFPSLNITTNNYLAGAGTYDKATGSFLIVDRASGSFHACMVANKSGSYYVDGDASNASKATGLQITVSGSKKDVKILGSASNKLMWACSNGINSWS